MNLMMCQGSGEGGWACPYGAQAMVTVACPSGARLACCHLCARLLYDGTPSMFAIEPLAAWYSPYEEALAAAGIAPPPEPEQDAPAITADVPADRWPDGSARERHITGKAVAWCAGGTLLSLTGAAILLAHMQLGAAGFLIAVPLLMWIGIIAREATVGGEEHSRWLASLSPEERARVEAAEAAAAWAGYIAEREMRHRHMEDVVLKARYDEVQRHRHPSHF
jgi:hypothetical protein